MALFEFVLDTLDARLVLFGGGMLALVGVLLSGAGVRQGDVSPGRRALVHAFPAAAVVLLATLMGRFEIAVATLFGTCVALLSAVIGFLAMAGSAGKLPTRYRPVWFFMPVAAGLAFISGFHGEFTWLQALVLVVEGVFLLWVWLEPGEESDLPLARAATPARPVSGIAGFIVVGSCIVLVGTFLTLHGAARFARESDKYSETVLAGILLSVTLALPLIRNGSALAEAGSAWSPMTSCLAVALINLCGTLPLAIVLAKLRHSHFAHDSWALESISPAYFLPSVWRVDAMVLVLLSILLVPVAAGRVKMDRILGGVLIVAYCAYLMAAMWVGSRMSEL